MCDAVGITDAVGEFGVPDPQSSPSDHRWDEVLLVGRHLGSAAQDDPPYCGFGAFPNDEQVVATCTTHAAHHELLDRPLNFDLPYLEGDPNDVEPDFGEVGFEIDISSIVDWWSV